MRNHVVASSNGLVHIHERLFDGRAERGIGVVEIGRGPEIRAGGLKVLSHEFQFADRKHAPVEAFRAQLGIDIGQRVEKSVFIAEETIFGDRGSVGSRIEPFAARHRRDA